MAVFFLAGTISGTLSSLLINIIAITCLPALFLPRLRQYLLDEPAIWLFAFSFFVVFIMIAINADSASDLSYVANFIPLILVIPIYALARFMAGQKTIFVLSLLLTGGTVIALIVALVDIYALNLSRAGGILTNQLVFARLALTFGFVAAFGFLVSDARSKYLFLLAPVLGIAVVILSGSRGALITVPFLSILLLGFVAFSHRQHMGKILLFFAAAVAIMGIVLVYFAPESQRLLDIFDLLTRVLAGGEVVDRSVQIRLEFYGAGWELFLRSPWSGYGWANLAKEAFSILDVTAYSPELVRYFHFHNDLINIAVAAGIPGITAWMAWLFAPVIGALASPRDKFFSARLYACLAITILYFVAGMTDVTFGYDMPTTAFVMISAFILGAVREKSQQK